MWQIWEFVLKKVSSADDKCENLLSEMGGNSADTKSRYFLSKMSDADKKCEYLFSKKWVLFMQNLSVCYVSYVRRAVHDGMMEFLGIEGKYWKFVDRNI